MKKIILAILLIIFPSLLSFAAKRALLIGINDYKHLSSKPTGAKTISDLKGSINDVKAMKEILIKRYGFTPEAIKVLIETEATKKNIIKAFNEWLIKGSKEGDLVLFYFSGHGSKVPDQNGDEDDGYDEVLCPYDIVPDGGYNTIIDDQLGDMLRQLEGRNVVIILDACDSGGMVRSIGKSIVSVLEQTPCVHPKFIPITNYRPHYFPKGVLPDKPKNCLFLTASKEDQIAWETNKTNTGDFFGAFTYAFIDGLKKLEKPTYQQVLNHVDKFIKDKLKLEQEPQISPNKKDIIVQLVFNTEPEKPSIPVAIPQVSRNVLVKIEPFGTLEDMQELKRKLENIPYVELVENDLVDRFIRGKKENGEYKVRLLNRIGDVTKIPPKKNIDELVRAMIPHLEYAYMVKQLAQISNPNPPFKVELWVTDKKRRDFRVGEKITFRFKSERDCYILLINIDQKGNFHIIFPNKYYKDNFVRANTVYEIPDRRIREAYLREKKTYFELQFGEPVGEETVKVIATTRPLNLRKIGIGEFKEVFQTISGSTRAILVKAVKAALSSGNFLWSEDTVVIRSHRR
ncbi:MAG TPA: DUF4384 domain-containing protein [Candidatus Desulfofervidus auxilii]|uniref:DUF4384 domain-containing protein n=1 Tax=Desulfofervidus auxilii TaxID=1621989 RepID=A0A7V0IAL4_DESA2|nr:DUF4384 domain-containing protein [Candidatus Desulfofervidus auxilii]